MHFEVIVISATGGWGVVKNGEDYYLVNVLDPPEILKDGDWEVARMSKFDPDFHAIEGVEFETMAEAIAYLKGGWDQNYRDGRWFGFTSG